MTKRIKDDGDAGREVRLRFQLMDRILPSLKQTERNTLVMSLFREQTASLAPYVNCGEKDFLRFISYIDKAKNPPTSSSSSSSSSSNSSCSTSS
jgi:hypothetical protein